MVDIKSILSKRSSMLSSIDQLESYLYDYIEEVIEIVEGNTVEELIDTHGQIEAAMLIYCYAILVDKTCNAVIDKLENIDNTNMPD